MCLAIPSQVKKTKKGSAVVESRGRLETAKTNLVKVAVGDWVFTQAGFIVKKLTKKEANQTLQYYEK